MVALASVLASLGLACSVNASYDGTMYLCPDGRCPEGYTCQDNVCVSSGVDMDAAGPLDGAADGAAPDAGARDSVAGDVLYFTFNDEYGPSGLSHDHGPSLLDGDVSGAGIVTGRYGQGRAYDGIDDQIRVPDSARLFQGNTLTFEAWIAPEASQDQAIIGDFDANDPLEVEYSFELTAAGGLAFYSNTGCTGDVTLVTTSQTAVALNTYTHVAVTWDGAEVRFYVNGNLADVAPFAHVPCEFNGFRNWYIGRRNDSSRHFSGTIDEVKVSSYAKTAVEIQMSMDHDTGGAGAVCGDRVLDGSEQCDGDHECCNAAACTFESDDTQCGSGTCQAGVCNLDGGRVTEGLRALYLFDEGDGTVVSDTSGVDSPLDLTIQDPLNVTWEVGALRIDASTLVASSAPADKISSTCKAGDEVTVEAWVSPGNDTQGGPARIVTISEGSADRNFTLGQTQTSYNFRVRSTASGSNGEPAGYTQPGDVRPGSLTHVVATRGADGERRMYVDGLLRGINRVDGDFSGWIEGWSLGLANEVGTDRTWLGTYHLVAVYCRALDGSEVARNFVAGSQ